MTKLTICAALSFLFSAALGKIIIKFLYRLKVGQPILSYVKEHKEKNGTATMGGVIFVFSSLAAYFIVYGFDGKYSLFGAALFFSFALIGFSDDFIKIKFNKNEGLKPWQKTAFLIAVSIAGSIYIFRQSQTAVYIPFTDIKVNLGVWFFPLAVFVFIATTNCVNLTDGLDGLAGSVSSACFLSLAIVTLLQVNFLGENYAFAHELKELSALCVSVAFSLVGFLIYNVNKASVFMGDTGSLALGGLMAFCYLISGNALYLAVIGWAFVLSGASVIIQVAHYKRTKRRVFLMAPMHHHFQHLGFSEAKITFVYASVTALIGLICAATCVGGINAF